MFGDLLDDDSPDDDSPDDAAAEAAPAVVPAPDPDVNRDPAAHNRLGVQHTLTSKLKMRLGCAKARISSLRKKAVQVISSGMAKFGTHVASVCFGRKPVQDSRIIMLAKGGRPQFHHPNRASDHMIRASV